MMNKREAKQMVHYFAWQLLNSNHENEFLNYDENDGFNEKDLKRLREAWEDLMDFLLDKSYRKKKWEDLMDFLLDESYRKKKDGDV